MTYRDAARREPSHGQRAEKLATLGLLLLRHLRGRTDRQTRSSQYSAPPGRRRNDDTMIVVIKQRLRGAAAESGGLLRQRRRMIDGNVADDGAVPRRLSIPAAAAFASQSASSNSAQ